MIKSRLYLWLFSFLMHSIVHFSHFVFEKTIMFVLRLLLSLLILNLSFVVNLKLNVFEWSQMDYFMFWWFKPIVFHIIMHIQRFLVITNRQLLWSPSRCSRANISYVRQKCLERTDSIGFNRIQSDRANAASRRDEIVMINVEILHSVTNYFDFAWLLAAYQGITFRNYHQCD